jgi:hypothetical protein
MFSTFYLEFNKLKKLILTITKLEKWRINNLIQNEQNTCKKAYRCKLSEISLKTATISLELGVCYISLFSHPHKRAHTFLIPHSHVCSSKAP